MSMTDGIKIEWEEPGPADKVRLTVVHGSQHTVAYRDPTESDLTRALELLAPEVRGRVIAKWRTVDVRWAAMSVPVEPERNNPMAEHLRKHGLPESWAEWARELRVNFDRMIGYRMTVSGIDGQSLRLFAPDSRGPWRCETRIPWCPTGIRANGMIDPDPSFEDAAHWRAVAEKTDALMLVAMRERDDLRAKLAEATTHPRSFVCDEEMRAALFADCAAAKRRGDALEKELAAAKAEYRRTKLETYDLRAKLSAAEKERDEYHRFWAETGKRAEEAEVETASVRTKLALARTERDAAFAKLESVRRAADPSPLRYTRHRPKPPERTFGDYDDDGEPCVGEHTDEEMLRLWAQYGADVEAWATYHWSTVGE